MTEVRGEMGTATCRHRPCTCPIDDTIEHCGPTCRQGIRGTRREPCKCGHAACDASDGKG